jgi:hypothetical protein
MLLNMACYLGPWLMQVSSALPGLPLSGRCHGGRESNWIAAEVGRQRWRQETRQGKWKVVSLLFHLHFRLWFSLAGVGSPARTSILSGKLATTSLRYRLPSA